MTLINYNGRWLKIGKFLDLEEQTLLRQAMGITKWLKLQGGFAVRLEPVKCKDYPKLEWWVNKGHNGKYYIQYPQGHEESLPEPKS